MSNVFLHLRYINILFWCIFLKYIYKNTYLYILDIYICICKYIYLYICIYLYIYVHWLHWFQVERSILFTNPGVLGSVGWMVSWHWKSGSGRQVGVNTIKWYQSLGSYDVLYIQICIYIYIYIEIYIYIHTSVVYVCIYWDMPKSKRTKWVNNLFVFWREC